MRTILRILAVLAAAIVLTAGACDPTGTELTDEGIVDSETGELVDLDDPPGQVEPSDDDATIDGDEEDHADAADEDDATDDEPTLEDEPDADEPEGTDAATEPDGDPGQPVLLGDPSGDDLLLELEAELMLDEEGRVTFIVDEGLRNPNGWYGSSMTIVGPDGAEGVVECSFRPDLTDEPTQCNAFEAATFGCGGSTPFTDPGSGPVVIETPFYVNVEGVAQFYPSPVQDGCADFTGAVVTSGFFGQWDPVAGQGSSTTIVDLPAQFAGA